MVNPSRYHDALFINTSSLPMLTFFFFKKKEKHGPNAGYLCTHLPPGHTICVSFSSRCIVAAHRPDMVSMAANVKARCCPAAASVLLQVKPRCCFSQAAYEPTKRNGAGGLRPRREADQKLLKYPYKKHTPRTQRVVEGLPT